LLCFGLLSCPVTGQVKSGSVSTTSATEIPHSLKQGRATQLIVDGKPFLALAGRLLNSSAASARERRYRPLTCLTAAGWFHASGLIFMPKPGSSGTWMNPFRGAMGFSSMAGQSRS